jgi:CMP-N,N'-diacetyllegionaminic acid synthase
MENVLNVAIIPARTGNKRLPGKNTRTLNGRPMIGWTIQAALESEFFDAIVVTTNDPEVMLLCADYPITALLREDALASDDASMGDVVLDVIAKLELQKTIVKGGKMLDAIVITLLQPTSPCRTSKQIQVALEAYLGSSDAEVLISVCELEKPLHWTCSISEGALVPIFSFRQMSVQMPPSYRPNGAIYIANMGHLIENKGCFYSEEAAMAFVMSRRTSVDVDTIEDFLVASCFLLPQAPA